jgi:hypothetical protein
MNPIIIREEYFPFLVENGFDDTGIIQWVDFGTHTKVRLKPKKYTCKDCVYYLTCSHPLRDIQICEHFDDKV